MLLKKIIYLLIGLPAGLALIKYRERVYQWTGPIGFAEKYLGNGGTFTLIVIVGSIMVLLSISYFLGAHEYLLSKIVTLLKF